MTRSPGCPWKDRQGAASLASGVGLCVWTARLPMTRSPGCCMRGALPGDVPCRQLPALRVSPLGNTCNVTHGSRGVTHGSRGCDAWLARCAHGSCGVTHGSRGVTHGSRGCDAWLVRCDAWLVRCDAWLARV
eukprot:351179-Chlamydomonas_euryale.AAC.5